MSPVSDPDLVAAALLSYFRRCLGKKWMTRFPKPPRVAAPNAPWWSGLPWDWENAEARTWAGFSSLSYWLSHASVYKVSQSVLSSLGAWDQGQFQMRLLRYLPSPEEVLQFQVKGIRPVTLLTSSQELWQTVERFPNAFELTIHDLIHADRFQRDPELKRGQMQFFGLLEKIVTSKLLVSLLKNDPKLREDFEYVLSDMNTVPVHGLQYLKAILIQSFLRQYQLPATAKLLGAAQLDFEDLFQKIIAIWEFPNDVREAIFRVCTPAYQADSDGPLIQNAISRWSEFSERHHQ